MHRFEDLKRYALDLTIGGILIKAEKRLERTIGFSGNMFCKQTLRELRESRPVLILDQRRRRTELLGDDFNPREERAQIMVGYQLVLAGEMIRLRMGLMPEFDKPKDIG